MLQSKNYTYITVVGVIDKMFRHENIGDESGYLVDANGEKEDGEGSGDIIEETGEEENDRVDRRSAESGSGHVTGGGRGKREGLVDKQNGEGQKIGEKSVRVFSAVRRQLNFNEIENVITVESDDDE